jgi:eukaryotic-like serine/threonine-protein kinase
VSEPLLSSSDAELRAHVERVLSANYELDREIGRGGMGIVYKAKDKRLKRQVAVKLLPPELAFRSEIRSRFLKEAETAAQLSHPNIVPIYSVDERDGLVFFVMAFVDGENLAVRMHRLTRVDPDETRRILKEVAEALVYAHENKVVHRDIKPDNILLSASDGRVMVTDFGIARAVSEGADSRLTATGMAIGTPAYMSPEQSMGEREIDGRSDLYSLGIVGYQMLVGELPFNAPSTPAMLVKHISERPTPIDERRTDVPPDLARAVMILLEKEPANRFPSAQALVVALETGDVPYLPTVSSRRESHMTGASSSRGGDVMGSITEAETLAAASGHKPSSEELARWNVPQVVQFRKKLAPFLAVGVVIVLLAIFDVVNMVGIAGIWSVFIAYQYAKLWTDGYDWRDVFKQPRDRLLFDVIAESIDELRALFDKKKRAELRARDRARGQRPSLFGSDNRRLGSGMSSGGASLTGISGAHAATVRKAAQHRDEILIIVETLPKREREQVGDVASTAMALYTRVESLALNLAELQRATPPGGLSAVEAEISRLEAQANPLDRAASEERIRRLAFLKRQRRAIADGDRRRKQMEEKIESCAIALQNMQFDVLRLKTGGQSFQQLTLMAEKAMVLASEVDNAVYVADEMSKLRGKKETGTGNRR